MESENTDSSFDWWERIFLLPSREKVGRFSGSDEGAKGLA